MPPDRYSERDAYECGVQGVYLKFEVNSHRT